MAITAPVEILLINMDESFDAKIIGRTIKLFSSFLFFSILVMKKDVCMIIFRQYKTLENVVST